MPGTADTVRYRYDILRRVVGQIGPDPDGAGALKHQATRNTYDAAGHLLKVEKGSVNSQSDSDWAAFEVQQSVVTTYDIQSRKVTEAEQGIGTVSRMTHFKYDALGRLMCTAVRMNPATWASQTDACVPQLGGPQGPDRITKTIYDAAGQVLQIRKAVGTPLEQAYATYTYSSNGKQTSVIDANGNRATLGYDGFDRQKNWYFPSTTKPTAFNPATPATAVTTAGAVSTADFEEYNYDASGNRTRQRKRDGSELTYQYDPLNRNIVKIVPERAGLAASATRDVYYGYDLRGLQTYARFDSAAGEGITTAYDGFGRQISSTTTMSGTPRTLTYQYDANGNRTRVTHPDAVAFSYSYDGLNRSKEVLQGAGTVDNGSSVKYMVRYTYDNFGRMQVRYGRYGDYASTAYDSASRVSTIAQIFNPATDILVQGFGYNPANQITTLSHSNDAYIYRADVNVNRTYASNGLNQYDSAGPRGFGYDLNGNLDSDAPTVGATPANSTAYVYDVENRLVSASGAGVRITHL